MIKRCPNCQKSYSDELVFCLDDGTELVASTGGSDPTVFAYDTSEIPTRVLTNRSIGTNEPRGGRPLILYLVIGILGLALIASISAAAYFYFTRDTDDSKETSNKNANRTEATQRTTATPTPSATPSPVSSATPAASPTAPPFPPPVAAMPSPSGNWSGGWSGRSAEFSAAAGFAENNGAVSGQIHWTLRRSSNPQKAGKAGLSAIEYVQGTFDARTGRLRLKGVRKDDPYALVILDTYDLVIARDGRSLTGRSRNGTFRLQR